MHLRTRRTRLLIAAILVVAGGTTLWHRRADGSAALYTIPFGTGRPLAVTVDARAGRAYVTDSGHVLSLLDTRDGRILAHVPAVAVLAVASRAGHLFVLGTSIPQGGSYNVVRMIDARTAAPLTALRLPDVVWPAGAVAERSGRVFVPSMGRTRPDGMPIGRGSVYVVDAQSGALLRTVRVGVSPWVVAVDGRTVRAFVLNRSSGSVSVLDAGTGEVLRTTRVGFSPKAVGIDELTGRVFVLSDGTHDGAGPGYASVSVLDARSGVLLRTVPMGTASQALAVDSRSGRVFIVGPRIVRVLDARSSSVVATVAVPGEPSAVAVDARTGRALVTATINGTQIGVIHLSSDRGIAIVLDSRTGTVLRMVGTGQNPSRVAIDERRGLAFVTNLNGASVSVIDLAR